MSKKAENLLLSLGLLTLTCAPSNAVNDAEKERVETAGNVDNYVHFASYNESQGVGSAHKVYGKKPWTSAEFREMQVLLSWIYTAAPGLLHLAAADHKLALVRVGKITTERVHKGTFGVAACTGGDKILLTDKFFDSKNKLWILLHELVHAADNGNYVAYSANFVSFAAPKIIAEKSSASRTKPRKELTPTDTYYYSLPEFLAYGFSDSVRYSGFTIPPSVGAQLTNPSAKHLLWRKLWGRAETHSENHRWSAALGDYNALLSIEDKAPLVHFKIACCYQALNRESDAAKEFLKAIEEFNSLKIPQTEQDRILTEYCYALQLRRINRANEAHLLLAKLLPSLDEELKKKALQEIQECKRTLIPGNKTRKIKSP